MKALLLNGSLPGDAGIDAAHTVLRQTLTSAGWAHHSFTLHEQPLAACTGCFECWTRTPGRCKAHDGIELVAHRFIQSDLVVLLTPVTFGGYSSELKKALDRCIGLLSPFFVRAGGDTRHRARYEHYPSLLALGMLPTPDPEDEHLFDTLVHRNAHNFHAPRAASRMLYRTDPPHRAAALLLDFLHVGGRAA